MFHTLPKLSININKWVVVETLSFCFADSTFTPFISKTVLFTNPKQSCLLVLELLRLDFELHEESSGYFPALPVLVFVVVPVVVLVGVYLSLC